MASKAPGVFFGWAAAGEAVQVGGMPEPVTVVWAREDAATVARVVAAVRAGVPPGADVVVVDDGSADGTADAARSAAAGAAGVEVVAGPQRGLPSVLNAVAEKHRGRDLVVIQGHVEPAGPAWWPRLKAAGAGVKVAAVAGAVLRGDGKVRCCGRNFIGALGNRDHFADADRGSLPRTGPVREVDGAPTLFAWFSAEALAETGGFDRRYAPLGLEADDHAVAVRSRGWKVVADPEARAVELERCPRLEGVQKAQLMERQAVHWEKKWGWHPEYPDLHAVRARWGATGVTWRIGERLLEPWGEERYPEVDVIVAAWNNLPMTRKCLEALKRTTYPRQRLWLLDNGSTDGTAEYLRELDPASFPFPVERVYLPVHVGAMASLNWLLKLTSARLTAKLDEDLVVSPGWLEPLVDDLREHPYAGLVGPKVVYHDRPAWVQSADARWWPSFEDHRQTEDAGQFDYLAWSNHVRGCCNVFRRRPFELGATFDLRYTPTQYEDVDQNLALRALGYDILYDGRVSVEHHSRFETTLSDLAVGNAEGNRLKLEKKWGVDAFEVLEKALDRKGRKIAAGAARP